MRELKMSVRAVTPSSGKENTFNHSFILIDFIVIKVL